MAEHEMEPPPAVQRCEHTIFLSHSGEEKSFVEQLCEDLKRVNHLPFFDQDSNCLPKGDSFPSLIFQAAEQCHVAVVVLSNGYLTSKWPMLELSTFLKFKKTSNPKMKLFPLFYKLSPSDLDAQKVETKWVESWKALVQEGKVRAEEIALWSEAVKALLEGHDLETERTMALKEQLVQGEVEAEEFSKLFSEAVRGLRPFNGLNFRKYGNSELKYRAAVVEEICKCVPPIMKYDTDRIRGYQRICEITSLMFEDGMANDENKLNICKPGCFYLGLYGMGGVGKTTLCGAMCSYFQADFRGRVCHVELQGNALNERIARLKHAIQQLSRFDNKIVDTITSEQQGLKLFRNGLGDQPPVFLAVDNVGDSQSARDEAREYIKVGLTRGSKVLVTSRSRKILESVLEEAKYCKSIPRLEHHEAAELFLSVAAPRKLFSTLQYHEARIVEACLNECRFIDDGYRTQQYHPLVLRALATYFHDVNKDDVMGWKKALPSKNKLQGSRESKHVNDILGLNYETMSDSLKLIFVDVAILFNKSFFSGFYRYESFMNISYHREWWDEETSHEWPVMFIASLHGISLFDAKMKVKELQRKSLIYESSLKLTMHDLYCEFARALIDKEGSREREWWAGQEDKVKRLHLFRDESKLSRAPKQLWQYHNLVCLVLISCTASVGNILDLTNLKNLRILIMEYCARVEEIVYSDDNNLSSSKRNNNNLAGCMLELHTVKLDYSGVKRISFLRHCPKLKTLSISSCHLDPSDFTQGQNHHPMLLENAPVVETLRLVSAFGYRHRTTTNFCNELLKTTLKLKNLKVLEFESSRRVPLTGGSAILDLSPLQVLTSLSVLSLTHLSSMVVELKGLDRLSQLTTLILTWSTGLRKLPDLALLPNLQRVCVHKCCSLEISKGLLTSYRGIKHEDDDFIYDIENHRFHQCLEPKCNLNSCRLCVDRHLECHLGDEDCGICRHRKFPCTTSWDVDCAACPAYNSVEEAAREQQILMPRSI